MSIPPLVCSTPPPPEQCVDEREPDDFDIRYSLSQEDDDSTEYDYHGYSCYDHYKTATESSKIESALNVKIPISQDNLISDIKTHSENHCKMKENIKPENLCDDVSNLVISSPINKPDENDNSSPEIVKEKEIERKSPSCQSNNEYSSPEIIEEKVIDQESPNCQSNNDVVITTNSQDEETPKIPEEVEEISDFVLSEPNITDSNETDSNDVFHEIENIPHDTEKSESPVKSEIELEANEVKLVASEVELVASEVEVVASEVELVASDPKPVLSDDDFGDFEDFKCSITAPNNDVANLPSVNPWENEDSQDLDVNFDANFDDFQAHSETEPPKDVVENVTEITNHVSNIANDDDDFGDFDDFQSNTAASEPTKNPQGDVFSLHSSINEQVIEKVLSSIYEEVIEEGDDFHVDKLETFLKETWRHLKETEIRQPYVIQWNNSNGQKSLLKSLCIDSRNILFAPKWSHNTPKFAANMGAAPLQPLKPAPATDSPSTFDNNPAKPSDTWVDPFTPNGQESCGSAEKPTKDDSTMKKIDPSPPFPAKTQPLDAKIYSNTMNIQPIRQYNLPDTHIFTPTDSEIPRSKTIHNDAAEATKVQAETILTENPISDDFDDFQDFKTATSVPVSAPVSIVENVQPVPEIVANKTLESQILEPVKLEPVVPTLNWPDPGEVKTTFDDFSDFISNSTSWSKDAATTAEKPTIDNISAEVTPTNINNDTKIVNDFPTDFDDEFDSFQSATPNAHGLKPTSINHKKTDETTSNAVFSAPVPPTLSDIAFDTSTINSSEQTINISVFNTISNAPNVLKSEPLQPNTVRPLPTQLDSGSILQPLPVTSLPTQKNITGQILQPLSLESYSSINWPSPGADLHDLSRFNPIETLPSLKSDAVGLSKNSSPAHANSADDDVWGDFVSSPAYRKAQSPSPRKLQTPADDDEWTDFVSSSSVKPSNGVNTISFNVHTNTNSNKYASKNVKVDIPTLNYITPKTNQQKSFTEKHLNL